MIELDFAEEQNRIKTILKHKAEDAKLTNRESDPLYKPLKMYPTIGGSSAGNGKIGGGAVIPKDFRHYPHCSCYVPNPNHPWPTLELAELDMLSEQEARNELSKMCILVRK